VQSKQVRAVLALSAVLCAAHPAKSQLGDGQAASVVRGEIETAQPLAGGYTVQLYDLQRHATLSTSDIHSNGQFEFRQTPYGTYLVTVTNSRGVQVYQGNFTVGGMLQPFIIQLSKEEINRPVSGTVSIQQLQHPPSRRSFDAIRAAQKFSDAGDFANAVASLQIAIASSPEFADAWVNLAAQHIRLGAYQQAVDETRHAIELTGPSTMTLSNLAYAQLLLGRTVEARESAEQALRLTPDDAHAHYVLGMILSRTHANDAEAVRHLQLAAPTLAAARDALAKLQAK
jgi:tetratricopeptide (TPR) repeat protein